MNKLLETEPMGWNPVEAPKAFSGLNCDCLNRNHNCDYHTFLLKSKSSETAITSAKAR